MLPSPSQDTFSSKARKDGRSSRMSGAASHKRVRRRRYSNGRPSLEPTRRSLPASQILSPADGDHRPNGGSTCVYIEASEDETTKLMLHLTQAVQCRLSVGKCQC